MKSDTSLVWPAGVIVLDPVAMKGFDCTVIKSERQFNLNAALRFGEIGYNIGVRFHFFPDVPDSGSEVFICCVG